MSGLLIIMAVCTTMVLLSIMLFYELLYVGGRWLNKHLHRPRYSIMVAVVLSFICHTLAVWIYAVVYYWIAGHGVLGDLHGEIHADGFLTYLYFSATTYSSLGFGDLYPSGPLRLLVAVEAINGLLLIGWSVTYTYVVTQRLFDGKS